MSLILILGNKYSWKFVGKDLQSFGGKEDITIKLEAIPLSNLFEHEVVLENIANAEQKGYPSLPKLKHDILENGFLHPVLAHYLGPSQKWILADGTHRLKAMQALNSKFILGLNLVKENYKRDCWVKTLPNCNKINYQQILENLSKKYPDTLKIRTVPLRERKQYLTQNCRHDLIAFINSTKQAYAVLNSKPEDRLTHLKLIKEIDTLLDTSEKDYKTRSELSIKNDTFILLPPPNDEKNDLRYLVENKNLQRIKGSRTVLAVRPVYFKIPFEELQRSENEIYNYLAEQINENLTKEAIGTVYAKKSSLKSLDVSWYYHTLLVGDKRILFMEAQTELEKKKLEELFIPLFEA